MFVKSAKHSGGVFLRVQAARTYLCSADKFAESRPHRGVMFTRRAGGWSQRTSLQLLSAPDTTGHANTSVKRTDSLARLVLDESIRRRDSNSLRAKSRILCNN